MFSVMAALGAGMAVLIFLLTVKKRKFPEKEGEKLGMMLPVLILGGLFFAMVFDKIAHFGETPWYRPAGIAFSGGLIGATAMFFAFYPLVFKKGERNIIRHIEVFIPCVLAAHFFGRIGCFLGGCCYGQETDSFLGVVFPENSPSYDAYGYAVKVLPTQLFEAAFLLVLFIVIFFVRNYKAPVYFISYGVWRFCIEFLRGDNRGHVVNVLSPSQFWSIFIVLFAIVLFVVYSKSKYKAAESGNAQILEKTE